MVFANILAQVVFPIPLGPQNKYACAICLLLIAFFNVFVVEACPTTESKFTGLYFRAETIKLSIQKQSNKLTISCLGQILRTVPKQIQR